jgi:ankyrin repeat protein
MSELDIFEAIKLGDKDRLLQLLGQNSYKKNIALRRALKEDQFEIFYHLFEMNKIFQIDDPIELLFQAASFGSTKIFRYLLDKASTWHFHIDIKPFHDATLLIKAAAKGHCEICYLILEKGANIDLGDQNNKTALYHAVINGHFEVCRLLHSKGANFDDNGPYLLERAIINGHSEICSFLLEHGIAKISLTEYISASSFGLGIIYGHLEICQILLEHGQMIDYKDPMQETFLHLACREKQLEIAKYIFEQMSPEIALSLNAYEHSAIQVWGQRDYTRLIDQDKKDENKEQLRVFIEQSCSDIL